MRAAAAFTLGASAWILLCLRWFDVAAAWRPAWLQALPAPGLALVSLTGLGLFIARSVPRAALGGRREALGLLLVVLLAFGLRAPLVSQASAGYVTADGALSGIVALRVRDGREHFVFVPAVPYSGSLKSHVTAPLAALIDPARAFAAVSLGFYAAFVAGTYLLGLRAGGRRVGLWAGLYAALSPAFVTQYSLSNDGNYVEVLAFGSWACLALLGFWRDPGRRAGLLPLAGLLLGLGFWCHILALVPALAVGLALCGSARLRAARLAPLLLLGFALGYLPGLLWNAGNGGESFRYLIPGLQPVGEAAASTPLERLAGVTLDHAPLLMGHLPGAGALSLSLAAAACLGLCWALGRALAGRGPSGTSQDALRLLAGVAAIDVALAVLALPYIPGNPRYLLFAMIAAPVLMAVEFGRGRRQWALVAFLALNVWGSAGEARQKREADAQWRRLTADLLRLGVRHCYSDFYLATKLNFLSGEQLVCSAKLGPSLTEYFFEYRRAVDAAESAAFVAVNQAQADKLERKLRRLGVDFARHDGMKPVLYRLSRKVDPQELFPERTFPLR